MEITVTTGDTFYILVVSVNSNCTPVKTFIAFKVHIMY